METKSDLHIPCNYFALSGGSISWSIHMGPQPLEKERRREGKKFCAAASLFSAAADSSPQVDVQATSYKLQATQSLFKTDLTMASSDGADGPFVPALIVVDMQEDFCPPVSLRNS